MPTTTERPCACGCGRDIPVGSRSTKTYYEAACRARASRKRHPRQKGSTGYRRRSLRPKVGIEVQVTADQRDALDELATAMKVSRSLVVNLLIGMGIAYLSQESEEDDEPEPDPEKKKPEKPTPEDEQRQAIAAAVLGLH